MQIRTEPSCRVGWQGSTLDYVVKAEGATEIVVPENDMKGVRIQVMDMRQVGTGVEARLQVEVVDSALY